MLRLFGLITCVSLAFIFPLFAYQINDGVIFDAVISTTVGTVAISILLK
jgi:hypothetical protein